MVECKWGTWCEKRCAIKAYETTNDPDQIAKAKRNFAGCALGKDKPSTNPPPTNPTSRR